MEASLKYHVSAFTASLSTKLVQIIQNPPLYLQRTPHGTQGFGKAEDFFCKIKSGTAHRQCRSLQRPQPFKYPPCCASPIGQVDLLMLFYHNSYKKKSQRVNVLPLALCTHFSEVCVLYFGRYKQYITHSAFYQ